VAAAQAVIGSSGAVAGLVGVLQTEQSSPAGDVVRGRDRAEVDRLATATLACLALSDAVPFDADAVRPRPWRPPHSHAGSPPPTPSRAPSLLIARALMPLSPLQVSCLVELLYSPTEGLEVLAAQALASLAGHTAASHGLLCAAGGVERGAHTKCFLYGAPKNHDHYGLSIFCMDKY
jgi:hypothetical protein